MHFFSLQKIAGHRETIFMMHFDISFSQNLFTGVWFNNAVRSSKTQPPHWTSLIWFFGLKISWHWQISETGILRNKVGLAGQFFLGQAIAWNDGGEKLKGGYEKQLLSTTVPHLALKFTKFSLKREIWCISWKVKKTGGASSKW